MCVGDSQAGVRMIWAHVAPAGLYSEQGRVLVLFDAQVPRVLRASRRQPRLAFLAVRDVRRRHIFLTVLQKPELPMREARSAETATPGKLFSGLGQLSMHTNLHGLAHQGDTIQPAMRLTLLHGQTGQRTNGEARHDGDTHRTNRPVQG